MLRQTGQGEPGFREGILNLAQAIETEALAKAAKNAPPGTGTLAAFQEVCFRLALAERQNAELLSLCEADLVREALPELLEIRATMLRLEAGRFAESGHLDPDELLYEMKHETLVAQYLSLRAAAAELALYNRRNGNN